MRKGLLDPDGTLMAHGFTELKPAAGQTLVDLPEDFNFESGSYQLVNGAFVKKPPAAAQPSTDEVFRAAVAAKINLTAADLTQAAALLVTATANDAAVTKVVGP